MAEEPAFGWCEAPIGRLDQDDDEIKENLDTLLAAILESKPTKKHPFITRVTLMMPDGPHHAVA